MEGGRAAQALQTLEGQVQRPVVQGFPAVQGKAEGGDAGGEDLRELGADGLIPAGEGHVEAIVTVGAAFGLPLAAGQGICQGLAVIIGAGKVHHRGGAAPEGGAGAGGEVIRRGGPPVCGAEVGAAVHKAGEKQAAGDIRHPIRAGESPSHLKDLLPFQQDIQAAAAVGIHDGTAPQQGFHGSSPPFRARCAVSRRGGGDIQYSRGYHNAQGAKPETWKAKAFKGHRLCSNTHCSNG